MITIQSFIFIMERTHYLSLINFLLSFTIFSAISLHTTNLFKLGWLCVSGDEKTSNA